MSPSFARATAVIVAVSFGYGQSWTESHAPPGHLPDRPAALPVERAAPTPAPAGGYGG